ncbi:hypothetical protein A2973_01700 [Candidatus Gottesmanbacteria bacterium RIFCSPLOWO2_01_FULL_49_10]|uniref:Uncharacterized protein n=1 Tax=Candidatus Gottesmanbacteria bacterium RIFCSPLOWO2_01_FULL_49_10 TaxID=1798396 RepID=A0A1F6AWY2_9BACT|nr:MAG: hypothetical protein A2973_01700 [Candidatus Gottesmanbacteria bacterium RIFCSPLOWO2_01_FULL_49_10]
MSENGEMLPEQEVQAESPVVSKVKGAMERSWEGAKETNKEYWEIRKAMQERLDWHGGGLYRLYVENMDKVTEMVWGKGDRGLGSRIMEVNDKMWTRLKGMFIASTSAATDLAYNAVTWPARLFLPIPKDIMKRFAIGNIYSRIAIRGAVTGVAAGEMAAVRGARAVGEAAVTAPEVAAVMLKRRAERAVHNILHPGRKPSAPMAK